MILAVDLTLTSDARTQVNEIEYVTGIPSVWPISRRRKAYVLDFSDPKYDFKDEAGKLIPVDNLVKRQVTVDCSVVNTVLIFYRTTTHGMAIPVRVITPSLLPSNRG